MSRDKISRNSPCPCGSGKKFKHCCINAGIVRQSKGSGRSLLPRPESQPATPTYDFIPGPFVRIDSHLKQLAAQDGTDAEWKGAVLRLSENTPYPERMNAYRLIRTAGVLPDEVSGFLLGHIAQWMPWDIDDSEDLDESGFARAMREQEEQLLREQGLTDLADLLVSDQQEYDRRYEVGRHFLFGPLDEFI